MILLRPYQIEPEKYRTWLFVGGRGAGKTFAASLCVARRCGPPRHILLVGEDRRDAMDQMMSCVARRIEDIGAGIRLAKSERDFFAGDTRITPVEPGDFPRIMPGSIDYIWIEEPFRGARHTDVFHQALGLLRRDEEPRMVISSAAEGGMPLMRCLMAQGTVTRLAETGDNPNLKPEYLEALQRETRGY